MIDRIRDAMFHRSPIIVKDGAGRERVVHPYCFIKGKEGILLHCYQVGGYSSSPQPTGWRNLRVDGLEVEIVPNQVFDIRPDFKMPKEVH